MCPTPNCSGAGFTIDIFPTDPDHPANDGWHDDDEDETGESEYGPADDEEPWDDGLAELDDDAEEWDPAEPQYKMMDEMGPDDDIEGEEWKYGLEPRLFAEGEEASASDDYWREEEANFDSEDRRPREIDWSDREQQGPPQGPFTDDDIPF
jgi:hypothetical protein